MASKLKHTPGPWVACLDVPLAVIEGHIVKVKKSPYLPVASVWKGRSDKGLARKIADAKLIAAAPDLLKTLRSLLKRAVVTESCFVSESVDDITVDGQPSIRRARKLLAKLDAQ